MRLEVTRKSDLAVRILRALSERPGRVKGPDLADLVGSTVGFVPQVVTPLIRAGWVGSDPGPTGGYVLLADLSALSILEVIEAVEGPTDSGRCVLAGRPCSDVDHCTLHEPWIRARRLLLDELARTSIADASIAADAN
jgi:Rrf2 family iron-sulfur cluster assembly transcriptional regulator